MSRGGRLSQIIARQLAKVERERRKHRERDWRRHVACHSAEVGYHISTGSMNPARTLGPGLLLGSVQDWWVFAFGPLIGAVIGVGLMYVIQGRPNEAEAQRSAGIDGD